MKKPKKPTTIRLATLETILPFSGAAEEQQTAPIEAIEVKIPPRTIEEIEDLFYMFVEYEDCNEFDPDLDI